MSWLKTDSSLKNKFINDINREDGIKNIINDMNFIDDSNIGASLSGKRKLVSWMLRTWAQQFDMFI